MWFNSQMNALDPASPESYLREDQFESFVAEMLDGPMLSRLSSQAMNQRLTDGLEEEVFESFEMDMARRVFIWQSISLFSIVELLGQDRALSEHHIAGEICRVNQFLQSLVSLDPDMAEMLIPDGMNVAENTAKTGGGLWIPPGTQLLCPTIDGNPRGHQVIEADPRHGMRGRCYQLLWRQNLTTWLHTQVAAGGVQILEPPFKLSSGRMTDHTDPTYYAPQQQPGSEKYLPDPTSSPPELVDA